MPAKCVVPCCVAGYATNQDKISVFRVPKNKVIEWKRQIPRENFPDSDVWFVCEQHFEPWFIERTFKITINGQTNEIPRDKPRLLEDAIPTIFPDLPSYLTKKISKPRKERTSLIFKECKLPSAETTVETESASAEVPIHVFIPQVDLPTMDLQVNMDAEERSTRMVNLNRLSSKRLVQMKEYSYRMKKKMNCQRILITKLRKKISSLHKEKTSLEEIATSTDMKIKNLPVPQQVMLREAFKITGCKSSKGMRYSNEWILQCLLLRIRSPAMYEFMRSNEILPLAERSTLYHYTKNLDCSFGFDETLFLALKEKMKELPDMNRRGIIMFDEMSVREFVAFHQSSGQLLGKVDYGKHTRQQDQSKDGNHILVFMFRPFIGGWIQTVGAFCAAGATPATVLTKLLIECTIHLTNTGMIVDATVCDGAATNKSVIAALGVSGKLGSLKNTFTHPTDPAKKIYVFIDTPHVLKCMRNNLINAGIFNIPNGDVIAHIYYLQLLKQEEALPSGLRIVPKLTAAHIAPNNFQRMNVRLAAQLFSGTVADGMQYYQITGKLDSASSGTIAFTKFVNELFDALNSRHPSTGVRRGSTAIKTLQAALQWLDDADAYHQPKKGVKPSQHKEKRLFLTKQTTESLRLTLRSSLDLIDHLHQSGFSYVLTARFQQDPLERFFGMVRQSGGDDHPTSVQFLYVYRLLSAYNLIKPPKRGNMSIDTGAVLLRLKTLSRCSQESAVDQRAKLTADLDAVLDNPDLHLHDDEYETREHDYATTTVSEDIVYYLGGYVVRKIKKITDCAECIKSASGANCEESLPTAAKLVMLKTRGGLQHPSRRLHDFLQVVEQEIETSLSSNIQSDVYWNIMQDIISNPQIPSLQIGCKLHATSMTKYLLNFYVTCRLHFFTKVVNKKRASMKDTKNHRKKSRLTT